MIRQQRIMTTKLISIRSLFLMIALWICGSPGWSAAQTPGGFKIAGTVVSKIDGHPLARVRVTVRDTKAAEKLESIVTTEDGKFQFSGVPAGKYSLIGAKRGFITAAYDQHEQYSTAIVTGADLDTETLVLRLAPSAIISGKVLDEAGEPVRHATVTAYRDDHSSGMDQIHTYRMAQTDDQGAYEITSLMPGTYFLSARAKPWYAEHPNSTNDAEAAASFDRSLDVAYPVTYYSDVTDSESATPIPIRGGERLQVEMHLNPVPSFHLFFRVPNTGDHSFVFPQLEQPAFDGSVSVQSEGTNMVSPGLMEVTGIPPGRYNVRFNGAGAATQMNGVDVSKDGEEIDASAAEATSTVKISVRVPGENTLPAHLALALRSSHAAFAGGKVVDSRGQVEFQEVPAGRYEMLLFGTSKPYSIARITAEGAEVSGHTLIVAPGSSPSVSLSLVGGSVSVEGTVMHAGKPFAGAMVVLVPKNPEGNRDLFRRDQSDLDGTFRLPNVIPGSYTVLAIENGWELDWSQPAVIAAYLNHGRTVEIGNQAGHSINLSAPVEVQSR